MWLPRRASASPKHRSLALLVATALVLSACATTSGTSPPASNQTGVTGVTVPGGDCVTPGGSAASVETGELALDALHLSGEQYNCADDVVVVDQANLYAVAVGAQLAAAVNGPLLFPHPLLTAELGRLKPTRIHVLGDVALNVPPGAREQRIDIASAVSATANALATNRVEQLPAGLTADTVVQVIAAIPSGDRVVYALPPDPTLTPTTRPAPPVDEQALISGLATRAGSDRLWLVPASSPAHALLAAAMAKKVGATVVAVDPDGLFDHPDLKMAFEGHSPSSMRLVGTGSAIDPWELSVVANGAEVPGGGFLILPRDAPRRYVAFYGHPGTAALGALGEQGPGATLERMGPFLEAFSGDGSTVVPTFEIIASVAAAGPTDDDDYSYEWPADTFEDWISFARSEGVYVVLDLQSGRDDFLSQARQYEELLLLPFVGLALDPEWRLGPDQVHLRQIGHVTSGEINEVVHWLADLVREHGLPQKMLVLHQFSASMIRDRDLLDARPELQLIVQIDGDGTEAQKDRTYANLTLGAEDSFWSWGWKNFFDEDEPGPPTPESTMSKLPTPVFVSYQ